MTAIRHLVTMSKVDEMKWKVDIQVRVAAIPGDWMPPEPGSFQKETMNALVDIGDDAIANDHAFVRFELDLQRHDRPRRFSAYRCGSALTSS